MFTVCVPSISDKPGYSRSLIKILAMHSMGTELRVFGLLAQSDDYLNIPFGPTSPMLYAQLMVKGLLVLENMRLKVFRHIWVWKPSLSCGKIHINKY